VHRRLSPFEQVYPSFTRTLDRVLWFHTLAIEAAAADAATACTDTKEADAGATSTKQASAGGGARTKKAAATAARTNQGSAGAGAADTKRTTPSATVAGTNQTAGAAAYTNQTAGATAGTNQASAAGAAAGADTNQSVHSQLVSAFGVAIWLLASDRKRALPHLVKAVSLAPKSNRVLSNFYGRSFETMGHDEVESNLEPVKVTSADFAAFAVSRGACI
jgi:hypothetical protein